MVEIQFDGARYGYWQTVEIHASVDDLCASIQLGISLPPGTDVLPLSKNSVVSVLVDGLLAATMRVDDVRRRKSASSHNISIEGRSLGRELIDCQYSAKLSNLKLAEIVKRLCDTFKVPLKVLVETVVVPDFAMQCESPSNALINAARAANLLLYPTADGGLVLTEPTSDAPVTSLVYGQHLLSYSVVDEYKLRFSEYVVKGFDHESSVSTKGSAIDDEFTFFRPLHIVADKYGQGVGGCDRRAELERNRRKARAHRLELEVQGWQSPAGLWAINSQVRVVIPDEQIDTVYLIGDRTFKLDAQGGSITLMQVMHREAFIGEKVPKTKAPAKTAKGKAKKAAKKGRKKTPKTVINPGE
jgi:prophage tail gpP-like protein